MGFESRGEGGILSELFGGECLFEPVVLQDVSGDLLEDLPPALLVIVRGLFFVHEIRLGLEDRG